MESDMSVSEQPSAIWSAVRNIFREGHIAKRFEPNIKKFGRPCIDLKKKKRVPFPL